MIDILMATYNGEKYIAEQIDSILKQSYPHFRLIIRDDNSTDGTRKILESYVERYPQKVILLSADKNLGVKGNFSALMEYSTAPYVMLSDQDDVWLADKVERSLHKIKSLEKEKSQPVLVHTDLKVVDEKLQTLGDSFWEFTGLNPSHSCLNRLLVQNVVTGCTIICNRRLLDLALPIPQETLMHDWWLALIAAAFGTVDFIAEPTILYRQHGSNTLGAQKFSSLSWFIKGVKKYHKYLFEKKSWIRPTERQAEELLQRYSDKLTPQQRAQVLAYKQLAHTNWFQSRYHILKHRFFRHGVIRNIVLLMTIRSHP